MVSSSIAQEDSLLRNLGAKLLRKLGGGEEGGLGFRVFGVRVQCMILPMNLGQRPEISELIGPKGLPALTLTIQPFVEIYMTSADTQRSY